MSIMEVIEKQRTGTGAIKRQKSLLKPKWETNKRNRYTKYNENKPCVQLFPKRWPLSNPNRTTRVVPVNRGLLL